MPKNLDKDEVLKILDNTKFVLKNDFINTRTPMLLYCKECQNTFKRKWIFIRNNGQCPYCKKIEIVNQRKLYLMSYNYELLEDKYLLQNKKMKLKCPNNHICYISWEDFYCRSFRCQKCKKQQVIDQNIIKNKYLANQYGYEVLNQEYNLDNKKTTLLLRCKSNHIFDLSVYSLRYNYISNHCPYCNGAKISDEYISNLLNKENYQLLKIERDSKNICITIKCQSSHEYKTTWSSFIAGSRCRQCLIENLKFSYDYVKSYIESFNYKLLSDKYINAKTPLDIICDKNHIYSTTFENFKIRKCPKCYEINNRGKNCNAWKGGVTSTNIYLRSRMSKWKKDSMINSNYKCIITGRRFDDIHHLYGYDLILKETFDISNIDIKECIEDYSTEELLKLEEVMIDLHYKHPLGVCLCNEIHTIFHQLYGYGNNIPQQFEEFKTRLRLGEFDDFLKEYNLTKII